MFTTKGVSENGSPFIGYGIREVKVTGIEAKEAEGNGTASLFINFQELNSEKKVSVRFPFSEKAASYSLRKIKHLAVTGMGISETDIDGIQSSTVTEYGAALTKFILNKPVRVKFSAEEIDGSRNGKKNWFKSLIGFPAFAEPISVSPTQLVFDPAKDIKRVVTTSTVPVTADTKDALPF